MARFAIARRSARSRRSALLVLGALALSATAADAADGEALRSQLVLWRFADATGFDQPRGVAIDPLDGAIYVANSGQHRIEVFSRKGRALTQFVHRVTGPDGTPRDGTPTALAFDRSGRLLVVDLRSRAVDVLDRRGRSILRLPETEGQPNAIAVGGDGTIWVGTTSGESKVHRFSPDYRPLGSWGVEGTEPGRLFGLKALAVLSDGSIAVACERTDLVVQIFAADGTYLRGFGHHDVGEAAFSSPSGLIVTRDGRIWVLDEIRESLQVFDDQGNLIAQQGRPGMGAGEFAHPSSLTYDGGSSIAWCDRDLGRVQVVAVRDE